MSQIKNLILDHPYYRTNPATREAYRTAVRMERRVRAWRKKQALERETEHAYAEAAT